MAKKNARMAIGLECSVCKSRNYITQKNTTETKEKITLKKYCKKCRQVREHTEFKLK
ncbi:50S ribosomal protein L33 [Candidatus Daviesbacteria bacterium]|nr:50S ribosomal protein L33 [Candidatus Daviesbacteria bacterium]